MYFETHAHYDDKAYNKDREQVLNDIYDAGVEYVINVGADMKSSQKSVEMSKKYKFIYSSVGVHPHYVANMHENDLGILADYTKIDKVVAIGEIGLDYYRNLSPRDVQIYWFKKMLTIADACNMPVIIHSRDASQETFDIIKSSKIRRGIVHCYSGSAEMAEEYAKMGFLIGVGGVVTYPNSRKLIETVEALPIENIVIETDCPYLSPEPKRGVRNDSQNLKYIVQKISEIKQIPHEEVAKITRKNALSLFDIK